MNMNIHYCLKDNRYTKSIELEDIKYLDACEQIDKFIDMKYKKYLIELWEEDINKKQIIYMQFKPIDEKIGLTSIAIVLKIGFLGLFGKKYVKFEEKESLSNFKNRLKELDIKNLEYLYNKYGA